MDLIEEWTGSDDVIVIDAVSSGAEPGTVHRLEAHKGRLPSELFRGSTHALGVAEAVELARALERLPARLTVIGIEGDSFDAGRGLTQAVEAAAALVTEELRKNSPDRAR